MADETLRNADALRRALAHLNRQLRRLRADHGISAAKLSLLGRLHRAGQKLTAVEIARLEQLQPQSLTRIIADLDQRGLITRRPGSTDRREIWIEISKLGTELLTRDAKQQNAWLAAAIEAKLTATEQALLGLATGLLSRLAEESQSLPPKD